MNGDTSLRLLHLDPTRYSLTEQNPVVLYHGVYNEPSGDMIDMHYELEAGIVRRGRMVRHYLDYDVELTEGQAWLCGAWEPHGARIAAAPCEVIVMVVYPGLLDGGDEHDHDMLRLFGLRPDLRPRGSAGGDMLRIADSLIGLDQRPSRYESRWRSLLLKELLLILAEEADLPSLEQAPWTEAFPVHSLQPSLELVFECKGRLTAARAARACGMTTAAFSRAFQKMVGTSFREFALLHRLRGSARHLTSTDDPLKVIAPEWGFSDVSHLHKCFVAHYGVSPGRFRARVRVGRPEGGYVRPPGAETKEP